jgi:hypothetical protein
VNGVVYHSPLDCIIVYRSGQRPANDVTSETLSAVPVRTRSRSGVGRRDSGLPYTVPYDRSVPYGCRLSRDGVAPLERRETYGCGLTSSCPAPAAAHAAALCLSAPVSIIVKNTTTGSSNYYWISSEITPPPAPPRASASPRPGRTDTGEESQHDVPVPKPTPSQSDPAHT